MRGKLAVICMGLLLVSGCGRNTDHPFYASGIVYCSESNPITFNPQLDTSTTTADATSHQIYDKLLVFDPDSGQIMPSLASSWLVSDDGLTYTFQLRKDVQFHTTAYFTPSRNFNANDVIFSIDRWRLDSHPYHNVSGGQYPYFDSIGLADNIKEIERINGYRIEITLKRKDSSFLANLATDFSVILSEEYGNELLNRGVPHQLDIKPIGTGPYIFQEYRKDRFIRYAQHKAHWRQEDSAEVLIFDITPRSSLRLAKLITQECDATAFPAQSELDVIRTNDKLTLAEKPGLNIGFWAFNTQKAPFNNPDVRRALAAAIDKNTLLEAVYFDSATRAKTLLPTASWAYQNDADDTAYNPVLARRLLSDAGIPPDFSMTIWAMPVKRAYNPNANKMAELIQRYLQDVGINAQIVTYDWLTFRRRLRSGEHDSVLIGWSADNGDPDNFYRPLLSCGAIPSGTNRAMWCNNDYDRLLDEAIETNDIDERRAIYQQVNRLLFEQQPLVPIAHAYRYQAYHNGLNGMSINPFGGVKFGGVSKAQ